MSYNTYLKQVQEDPENVAKLNKKLGTIDTLHDSQVKTVKDTYTQQIADIEADYEDADRENAVQKKLNEFYIAEEMANMGSTNSGLNRTQITANQLYYANNKAKLDQKRQSMVDALTREVSAKVADVENSRLSYKQAAQDEWDADNKAVAQNLYTAKVNADAEVEKARIAAQEKASYIIQQNDATLSKAMQGSFSDNGISVKEEYDEYGAVKGYTYVDNNSGKSSYFARGINPFTGTTNDDVKNGTFKNGYQPNNVSGKKFIKSVGTDTINGKEQNVWMSSDSKLWIWDGRKNKYLVYDANDDGVSDMRDVVYMKKEDMKKNN